VLFGQCHFKTCVSSSSTWRSAVKLLGRLILAALNGEVAKLVTEAEAGIVVPSEDPASLEEVIMHYYKMKEKRASRDGHEWKEIVSSPIRTRKCTLCATESP